MVSPLVRRMRLGVVMRELRDEAGMTQEQLAAKARVPRTDIPRLEKGDRRIGVDKILALLDALGYADDSDTYRTTVRLSREALERGWWEEAKFAGMSDRQKRCADVESGSRSIRLYRSSVMPWMLQTPEFVAAYDAAWRAEGTEVDPVQGAARLRRQAEVLRTDGPPIEVLLEEQVIRRPLVDAGVWAAQLRHLVQISRETDRIGIRVLPVECIIGHHSVPLIPFELHAFDDPDDGIAMLVTTHNDDLLVYDQQVVAHYVRLCNGLRDAAMSDADTAAFIEEHAARLAAS